MPHPAQQQLSIVITISSGQQPNPVAGIIGTV
jgi:hypothetical protein